MDKVEYERLKATQDANFLSIADLHDRSPRTLIYGLDDANNAVHVYIDDVEGDINVLRYGAGAHAGSTPLTPLLVASHRRVDDGDVKSNKDFVPGYRCYPEHCDYEFCSLLQKAGLIIPFGRAQFERQRPKGEPYAAPVMPSGAQPLTNLNKLGAQRSLFKRLAQACTVTASNVLWEACRLSGVSFIQQPVTKDILCQNADVSKVLQAGEALAETLLEHPPVPSSQIADAVCQSMFGCYPDIETLQEFGGEIHMSMTLEQEPEATIAGPVIRSLNGRPFVIRMEGSWVHCIYSVFGDASAFVKKRGVHAGY